MLDMFSGSYSASILLGTATIIIQSLRHKPSSALYLVVASIYSELSGSPPTPEEDFQYA